MSGVLSTKNQTVGSDVSLGKVLVVDDDADMRLYLSTIIASTWEEADVVEFDPIRQTVKEIGSWSDYDVVVLDYLFGESEGDPSGLDWLRQYSKDPDYPPTVFVSAYGDEDVVTKALYLGALSYVPKGDNFAARLVEAIEGLPDVKSLRASHQWLLPEDIHPDLDISEEELNKHKRVEIESLHRQVRQCAFMVMCVDQMDILDEMDAETVLQGLEKDVVQWIEEDGAKVDKVELVSSQIRVNVSHLLGDEHAEMISQSLCEHVHDKGFDLDMAHLKGTVSIGIVLEEVAKTKGKTDVLFASAERACQQAAAESGNRFVFKSLERLREAQAAKAQGVSVNGKPINEGKKLNLVQLIRSGQVGIQFQQVLNSEQEHAVPYYLAAPCIKLTKEESLSSQQESRLLIAINNSFDMDRLAVIQAQRLLHKDSTHKDSRVVIDISSQSAVRAEFWGWLIKRLRDNVDGLRMIFSVSLQDAKKDKLAKSAIIEASYHGKFRLAVRGMVDSFKPEQLPESLPFRVLMGDISGEFSINRCEQTVKLGVYAHQRKMMYILRGVDNGEKLVCAYASKADMMQGMLTSEFSEMEMKPLDASFEGGRDRVLWFDSRYKDRQARRLAEVIKRESEDSN